MARHRYILVPGGSETDLAAYREGDHCGPLCVVCGIHVCISTCKKRTRRLIPLDQAKCHGSKHGLYVVYETLTRASLSFHTTVQGAESESMARLFADRRKGIIHHSPKPYTVNEEELWL